MTDLEQWTPIITQIAQLRQSMLEVPKESQYYKRAQEYADVLMDMLQNAWMTNALKPVVKVKAKGKKKGARPRVPYINNKEDRQHVVDIFTVILNDRFSENGMELMNGGWMSSAKFFAYTYSAFFDKGIVKDDNLTAFCDILKDAVAQSSKAELFTTEYNAISRVVKSWNKLMEPERTVGFVHIDELSVEELEDNRTKDTLIKVKREYAMVLDVLRNEGLVE